MKADKFVVSHLEVDNFVSGMCFR